MKRRLLNIKRGGGLYDADFQAWIDYNILQGYSLPDETRLNAANDFVIGLKADGIWSKMDYLALRAWNDLNAENCSRVDFVNQKEAIKYGGVSYTVNGFQGNKVDGYLDLNFNPYTDGVNFTLNNAGRGVLEFSDDSRNSSSSYYFGIASTANVNAMRNTYTNQQNLNSNTTNVSPTPNLIGIGLKTNYRDDSSNVRSYFGGTEYLGTQASNSTNYDNSITMFRSGSIYSDCGDGFVFFSSTLTSTENDNLKTRLNTYLSAIGLTPIA
ncbi:MAG: hypothetical protein QXI16_02500 [Sulfolobaceae archaeon]